MKELTNGSCELCYTHRDKNVRLNICELLLLSFNPLFLKLVMSYDREMSPLFDPHILSSKTRHPIFSVLNPPLLLKSQSQNYKENESNNSCLLVFTIILQSLEMFEMLPKLMGMGHTHDSTQQKWPHRVSLTLNF